MTVQELSARPSPAPAGPASAPRALVRSVLPRDFAPGGRRVLGSDPASAPRALARPLLPRDFAPGGRR